MSYVILMPPLSMVVMVGALLLPLAPAGPVRAADGIQCTISMPILSGIADNLLTVGDGVAFLIRFDCFSTIGTSLSKCLSEWPTGFTMCKRFVLAI